jgi:hypothetical protein
MAFSALEYGDMKSVCSIAFIFLGACQVVPENKASVKEVFYEPETSNSKILFDQKCPPNPRVCEEKYDPTQCYVKKYKGREFLPWNKPIAWGDNPCLSLEKLNELVCELRLEPNFAQGIECVPDASRATCASVFIDCRPKNALTSLAEKSVFCVADSYQGQVLSEEQKLVGWGMGQCEAEKQLKSQACRMNLNPAFIGEMKCFVEPRIAECTRKKPNCNDKAKITNCRGTLKGMQRTVEATADSECAAREMIAYRACENREAPSNIKNIECR